MTLPAASCVAENQCSKGTECDCSYTCEIGEFGCAHGKPVIVFHGGPGFRCTRADLGIFDPTVYRVALFNQRGCPDTRPSSGVDHRAFIAEHPFTWRDLARDADLIRRTIFGEEANVIVFGGSWAALLRCCTRVNSRSQLIGQSFSVCLPGRGTSTSGSTARKHARMGRKGRRAWLDRRLRSTTGGGEGVTLRTVPLRSWRATPTRSCPRAVGPPWFAGLPSKRIASTLHRPGFPSFGRLRVSNECGVPPSAMQRRKNKTLRFRKQPCFSLS